jgi:hypothetical protein
MSQSPSPRAVRGFKVLFLTWLLGSALVLLAAGNIWLDPWLRNKSHRMSTLVLVPLSRVWLLAFILVAIFCALLVLAQILVVLDEGIPPLMRMGTGFVTVFALLLCVLWFRVSWGSQGASSTPSSQRQRSLHSVTLSWGASNSPVLGYNVYRSPKPGGPYTRINPDLVRGLTYSDHDVQSGMTYYYVTRAVDAKGRESGNSNESPANVP